MFLYDTHVHSSLDWYEPFESLLYQMDKNGVNKALLLPFHGNNDCSYLFECKKRYPDRVTVCIQVDEKEPDAADQIRRLYEEGAEAIRLLPDEPCSGDDPYALWRVADELKLPVSCYINLPTCSDPGFRNLIESMPNVKIVLEHLSGASRTKRYPEIQLEYLDDLLALAEYPNIYLKFPGFGELFVRPYPFFASAFTQAPDFTRQIYDAFGAKRMMWGSDFPLVSSREGYANALRFPMEHTPWFSEEDKEWVFGKTALSVFG